MKFSKRLLSMVLAGALTVAASISAFAVDDTVITGQYRELQIDVTVPADTTALINPYGLPIDLSSVDPTLGLTSTAGLKIVNLPMALQNNMSVDLNVGATLTGEVRGDLRLSAEDIAEDDTSKSAFVYLQMMPATATDPDVASIGNEYYTATWPAFDATKCLVLQDGRTAAFEDPDGALMKLEKDGKVGLMRLAGNVTKRPREDWTTSDGFTATVAYTFTPAV